MQIIRNGKTRAWLLIGCGAVLFVAALMGAHPLSWVSAVLFGYLGVRELKRGTEKC